MKPCRYCERGIEPIKLAGWFWHYHELIGALVRCADDLMSDDKNKGEKVEDERRNKEVREL